MFGIPKEAEGRRVKILCQNVAAFELKVSKVTEDEIIGMWDETEEEHVSTKFIVAWSYATRKEMSEETKRKIREKKAVSKTL
jgi:hypothetical protein